MLPNALVLFAHLHRFCTSAATFSRTFPLNDKGVLIFQLGLQAHCLLKLTIVITGLQVEKYMFHPFFTHL